MSTNESHDVYTNTEDDIYPGAKERSRPGHGPGEQIYDRVPDINGRMVSNKPANKAILAAQKKRKAHEVLLASHEAERSSQNATSKSSSVSSILSTVFLSVVFFALLSNFLTSSWSFGLYPVIQPKVLRYWRTSSINPDRVVMREFTPVQLSMFDGSSENLPVYVAIGGDVYDVSAGRRIYGKGGSYNMMAGRDASRSFTTGCFETHLTHDLRGLSEAELKSLEQWKSFFSNHAKYFKVGTVLNSPIDPRSPIPPGCKTSETAEHVPAPAGKDIPAPLARPGDDRAERGRPEL